MLNAPSPARPGQAYTVNWTATDPGDDRISQWSLNWGDGVVETYGADVRSATHAYANPANIVLLRLGAVDEDSAPGSDYATTQVISVVLQSSQVSAGGPYVTSEGGSLALTASAPGTPVEYGWDVNNDGRIDRVTSGANADTTVFSWDDLQNLTLNTGGLFSGPVIRSRITGSSASRSRRPMPAWSARSRR